MAGRAIDAGVKLGPYSAAMVAGGFCFVSGQGGLDPRSGERVPGGIGAETRQALENVKAVLTAAGFAMSDVVKVNCYLRDFADWTSMNAVYTEYFSSPAPARAAVEVGTMPAGLGVEIECIAYRDAIEAR